MGAPTVRELLDPTKREDHEGSPQVEDGDKVPSNCLVMAALHYTVSASVGLNSKAAKATPIVLNTGAGHNVIRRSSLPEGWKQFITTNKDLPTLCDASGNVLASASEVLLRFRFVNAFYRVTFIVVDNLSCPVLVGTKFLNRHVDAIRCRKGIVEFTGDTIPILGNHCPGELWRNPDKNVVEY